LWASGLQGGDLDGVLDAPGAVSGVLAGGLHGQDRAGVEDLVEALVELEPLAVLDVDRSLLGPAGRLVADGQAQGQAAA
jgi:hypothetical protein